MADSAVRKMSYGPNALVRYLGFVYLFGGLGGLYAAFAAGTVEPLEVVLFGPLAAGAVPMAFWRVGLVVDPGAGTLTTWWGVLVPLSRTVHPLAAISHVRLLKQIRHTGKGAQVTYLVLLMRRDVGEVQLWDSFSYPRARQRAEALARLLQVDLRDESSGEVVVRESRFLDEPLAERYRRLGTPAPFREAPPGAVARVVSRGPGASLIIEIPPTGFRMSYVWTALVLLAVVLALPLVAGVAEMLEPDRAPGVTIFFAVLVSPAVLGGLALVSHLATAREIISVSPAGIEVESRGWLRRTKKRLAAAQIEEIVPAAELRKSGSAISQAIAYSAGARAVLIRTDKGVTGVGRWVSEAEQAWLRDVLVHGLVGSLSAGASPQAPAPGVVEPRRSTSGLKWFAGLLAVALLAVIGYESGVLRKLAGQVGPADRTPAARTSQAPPGYELAPGPGSGHIRIYARGVRASLSGRDVRVAIEEVLLIATSAQARTSFQDLSLSIHRRAQGNWQLVGSATPKGVRSALEAGSTYTYSGPQEFLIAGAADACAREPCHFRVHVLGQVGAGRPGWDVTELAELALR